MKQTFKICALGLTLLLAACHPQTPGSGLKEDEAAEETPVDESQSRVPFGVHSLSDDETKLVASRIGYGDIGTDPSNGKCIGCHQSFNNIDELERLYSNTVNAFYCFYEDTKTAEGAGKVLDCLSKVNRSAGGTLNDVRPAELGFLAAGVEHKVVQDLFKTAGREAEYAAFKENTRMPLGDTAVTDGDFELLLSWVVNYYPNLADFLKHDGPSTCSTDGETQVGSKLKDYVTRMSEGGEGWEFVNLARGVPMFACQDGDKHNCFTQQKDGQDIFALADQWKSTNQTGHIRILHQYDQYTSYWIRSSADGRFVGNGGEPSSILDLQGKLTGAGVRKIAVEANYDPGFLPDNSGFIFQGDKHGSRICEQSILENGDLITIDFMQLGCSTSNLQVGLYQAIGNSLDSGDIHALSSYFSSDDGYYVNRDVAPLFGKAAGITIDTIRHIDTRDFEKVSSLNLNTPYHGSWSMSPANKIATSVVSGSNDGHATHGGYRLFLVDEAFGSNGQLPAWGDESTALLCTQGGEKPNMSFDERMLTFYRYEKKDHSVNSTESSSDIFVFDLLKSKTPVAVTQMPKGFYAQFPHFRSDGWLYFSVYDANTDTRYLAATDISIHIEKTVQP